MSGPDGKIVLTRMWTRTGSDGALYYAGRCAGARILVLPNRHPEPGDDAPYLLVLAPNDLPKRSAIKE